MSDLRAHIVAQEERRYGAMLAADTTTLREILSSDLHYMHSNATSDTKESYIDKIASGRIRYLHIDAKGAEVRIHGDHALVLGHLRAKVVSAGESRTLNSKFIGVWRLEDEGWRFEAFAPTPIP